MSETTTESKIKLISYYSGDWTVLVKDGKIVYENHSISARDALKSLGIAFEEPSYEGDEDGWYDWIAEQVKA